MAPARPHQPKGQSAQARPTPTPLPIFLDGMSGGTEISDHRTERGMTRQVPYAANRLAPQTHRPRCPSGSGRARARLCLASRTCGNEADPAIASTGVVDVG
jgi:hypothetical protein